MLRVWYWLTSASSRVTDTTVGRTGSGGCAGAPIVCTTVPAGAPPAWPVFFSQSRKAEKTASSIGKYEDMQLLYSALPWWQTSLKASGTQPPPLLAAAVTTSCRLDSVIGEEPGLFQVLRP
jgi:hypothetical protein